MIKLTRILIALLTATWIAAGGAFAHGHAGSGAPYHDGVLLVKFKKDASEQKKAEHHKRHGSTKLREYGKTGLQKVRLRSGIDPASAAAAYAGDHEVEYVEPDYQVQASMVPSDQQFFGQWALATIKAADAWDSSTGSDSVVIAVNDSGIDYTHPDLQDNLYLNQAELNGTAGVDDDHNGIVDDIYGFNAVNNTGDPRDDNGHGTNVAGIIGAVGNNQIGVSGVNWKVKILACKFLGADGTGFASDAIECLQYIKNLKDSGVNIVASNNSWSSSHYSQALYDVVAAQQDILFVAAAGNSSSDNDASGVYPASFDLPNVISVAASTSTDSLAGYSNFGRRSVHVAAPGSQILTTARSGGYASFSGTSAAAPHVAGLAALIKARYPEKDGKSVKNLLLSTGDTLGAFAGKTLTGRRINALDALTCLDSRVFTAVEVPATIQAGVITALSALSINCDTPVDGVTVTLSGGEVIQLKDDGVFPDAVAGDGLFTGAYLPVRGTETFTFSSPLGSETVTVGTPLVITNTALPAGTVGSAYSQTLTASNGVAPLTWTVVSGALPAGLSLSSSGVISGTPGAPGGSSFTVRVFDAAYATTSKALSLTINPSPLAITTSTLPPGATGTAYSRTLSVIGGVGPCSWSLASGSLPPGLSLGSSGVISGTPTVAGSPTFTVQVTDAVSATATKSLTLTVTGAGGPLAIATTTLASGTVGTAYSAAVRATGGTLPYTWSLTGGYLPAGLTLASDGTISGLPSVTTTRYFTVKVADTAGASLSKSLSITVTGSAPLLLTTAALPDAVAGTAYSQTFTAFGGKDGSSGASPYLWSVTGGGLPSGMTLSSAGVLSGTPAAVGTFGFTVQVKDGLNAADTKTFNLNVAAPPAVTILTSGLPGAAVGAAYAQNLSAAGGTAPYSWYLALSTTLPAGLSLSANGTISGVPATSLTKYFTIGVRDAGGVTATKAMSIKVDVTAALSILSTSLPNGMVGAAYSQSLGAAGGVAPYTWSLATGALPAGLSLSSYGVISGTPTASGSVTFKFQVTDAASATVTKSLTMTVGSAPVLITTASLPSGVAGTAYTLSLAGSGGVAPYAWTLASGALPSGLSLSSAGVISGTPSDVGSSTFTVQVTDAATATAARSLTISIVSAPLVVTTATLSPGVVGIAYSQTLVATGGTAPYAWTLASGTLPAGLSLTSAGVISGTPTTAGGSTFAVQVSDAVSGTAAKTLSLTINPAPLVITTSTLPSGVAGTVYSQTLAASGGVAPYTWSLASGTLPAGLSLSGAGVIGGTAAVAGSSTFTVQATDAASVTATTSLTLTVNPAPLVITTATLPTGVAATAYSQTLAASGGTGPYAWTLASGTLPAGLSLSSAGVLGGTPAAAGSSTFLVQVTDAASATVTTSLTLTVNPAPLVITTLSLPSGVVGTVYSQTLAASGGVAPYAWILASGTLPTGLSLSNFGVISGTPAAAGSSTFTVQVTEAASATVTTSLTLTVNPAPLVITTATLSAGVAGTFYSQALAANGGVAPYAWTLASGTLPSGLSLSGSGVISGTPAAAGSSTFTVQVADAASAAVTKSLTLTVNPAPLVITISSLPSGVAGTVYSQTLAATGGVAPFAWTQASGTLPSGLTLSGGGVISGTPAAAGSSTFTVQVTDAASATVTKSLTLTVNPAPLVITTASLPAGTTGTAYIQTLAATGGVAPYSWSLASGTLPAGLSLSGAGAISGTPTGGGSSTFTVQVSDASNSTVSKAFTLSIATSGVLTLSTTTLPSGTIGAAYSAPVRVTGGTLPYTWSVSGGYLPAGLVLGADGSISGVPSVTTTRYFTVKVVDGAGANVSKSLSITINGTAPLSITTAALPNAVAGTSYSQTLAAFGGKDVSSGASPYAWSVVAGSLPPGMTLSSAGVLSGTPAAVVVASFTIQVKDGLNATDTRTFNLSVAAPAVVTILTATLPNGSVGVPYSQSLSAAGGTTPFTWYLVSGNTLPAGFSLSADGVLSGTPAASITKYFTIGVRDASGVSATKLLSVKVM